MSIKRFIPTQCPECGTALQIVKGKNEKYKLVCPDTENCIGVSLIRFQKGMSVFNISGIGEANYELLFKIGLRDIADVLSVSSEQLIGSGFYKKGRATEKLVASIQHVKTVKFSNVVESLQIMGVGQTISKIVEAKYNNQSYDFTGIEYAIRDEIENAESVLNQKIRNLVSKIESLGVDIVFPIEENNADAKFIEFTGSPKEFGFSTKEDFLSKISSYGFKYGSLNAESAYLVTDDMGSSSSKMKKARKLGVEIITYGDLYSLLTK